MTDNNAMKNVTIESIEKVSADVVVRLRKKDYIKVFVVAVAANVVAHYGAAALEWKAAEKKEEQNLGTVA